MKRFIRPTVAFLLAVLCLSLAAYATAEPEVTAGCAPVAENLEITTYRGVSVGGVLSAVDPDGDDVTFTVTTPPGKGTLEVEEDGHFVYTPDEGRRGKDYFGYKAVDSEGNSSQEATVIIRLVKQKTKVTYSDMDGNGGACAAVTLAERGLFTGENLAGSYVFSPDTPVTRSQFLAMCIEISGAPLLQDVSVTGFADDGEIEAWAKPYVGTALRSGVISGYTDGETSAVFGANRAISVGEAAVILDRALDLTDTSAVWSTYEEAVPAWASQSMSDLAACGMLPHGVSAASAALTRVQAAEMLAEAMRVLDDR